MQTWTSQVCPHTGQENHLKSGVQYLQGLCSEAPALNWSWCSGLRTFPPLHPLYTLLWPHPRALCSAPLLFFDLQSLSQVIPLAYYAGGNWSKIKERDLIQIATDMVCQFKHLLTLTNYVQPGQNCTLIESAPLLCTRGKAQIPH